MRLIRLAALPARISADVRAALTSISRGANGVGGVAVMGVRSPDGERELDAVIVLPRGVVLVVGVDLPDPAMRLEAPLDGPWKADGWPLVTGDDAINPAIEAMAVAKDAAAVARAALPARMPVSTVVAVGPYVDVVDAPPAELAGPTRVLYPTGTSLLAAVVSLGTASAPCTVAQAKSVLAALAPDAKVPTDEELAGEGFTTGRVSADGNDPAAANTTDAAAMTAAGPTLPGPAISGRPTDEARNSQLATKPALHPVAPPSGAIRRAVAPTTPGFQARPVRPSPTPRPTQANASRAPGHGTAPDPAMVPARRWLPIAAVAAALVAVMIIMVLATSGDGRAPEAESAPTTSKPSLTASAPVDGITFQPVDTRAEAGCAEHAIGDLQSWLHTTECEQLRRASFTTTIDGTAVAVTVSVAVFADPAKAQEFRALADSPGAGSLTDLATESGSWPAPVPTFAGAAYISGIIDGAVRLVQAGRRDGPSTPDDPVLTRAAAAAVRVPVEG